MTDRDVKLGLLGTAVAVTVWGATGVIVKWIDMEGLSIAFWRFLLYAIVLTVWTVGRGGHVNARVLRRSLGGGISLGLDVALFFTALKLTTVVNATTIGSLQPLVVSAIAARFFGERIRGRDVIAALVAIAAVVVIVTQSAGTPEWQGAGDLAAVGALLAWSAYFVFAKLSVGRLTPHEYTVGTGWWTAAIAAIGALLFGQDLGVPAASNWIPILVLVFGAGVLGHSVMNWSLVRVPLWLASTLTLLVPVVSSLAAWAFLDEPLTVIQLLAMAVVLAALAVVVTSQRTPEPVRVPQAPVE